MGVPFAAIIDLDTLLNTSGNLSSPAMIILKKIKKAKSISLSQLTRIGKLIDANQKAIAQVKSLYANTPHHQAKKHLPKDVKELLRLLSKQGIFIVPTGELKTWYRLSGEPVEFQLRDFIKNPKSLEYQGLRGFLKRIETYLKTQAELQKSL
jgi:hypothetical protein